MRIIGQIFEEKDYNVFKRLPDNRDVLSARLNKLIASISEKYIVNPIIVNEKMEIIDGQGRYEALKALNKPIQYIISPGATSDDCRRMNKYNTRWAILDFAKSYAKAGIKAYQLLLLTCQETGYPISRVLRLSNHGSKTREKNDMSLFERGKLYFSEEDVKKVKDLKVAIQDCAEALQFTGRLNEAFVVAIKVVVETPKYNHKRMIENCKKCRASFAQMSSLGDQLVEFERIYNKGCSVNKLYFSDYMRTRGKNVRSYENDSSPYTDIDVSTLKMEGK